jgi:hypothetical protein
MPLPTDDQIEIPLLEEIEKAGGRIRPREVYSRVAQHFPKITREELESALPSGGNRYTNRVQWARQGLATKGELDASVRGFWVITEAGRRRLQRYKALGHDPKEPRRRKGLRRKRTPINRGEHDDIAHAMEKIGKAFGFDTLWKPAVNRLRPGKKSFTSKRKTLDVAWGVANLTWVPIEVQIAGSVGDLIYRFQQVHQWSLRLVVITSTDFAAEIKEAIADYPFRDKVVVLEPQAVLAATRSLDRLLELRAEIFES